MKNIALFIIIISIYSCHNNKCDLVETSHAFEIININNEIDSSSFGILRFQNDTMFFISKVEAESSNAIMYRRIYPAFFDSIVSKSQEVPVDTNINAVNLLLSGLITPFDTIWSLVNRDIVPGSAVTLNNGQFEYIDYKVHDGLVYQYRVLHQAFVCQ